MDKNKIINNSNDIFDIERMKKDGVNIPINIPLTGDEMPIFLQIESLSVLDLRSIYNYISSNNTSKISRSFSSLDESRFNTRMGYAVATDNKVNVGHSSKEAVMELLTDNDLQMYVSRHENNVNLKQFAYVLTMFASSIKNFGIDTWSDFIILTRLNELREYTKSIFKYVNSGEAILNETDGTISIKGISYLAVPSMGFKHAMPKSKYNSFSEMIVAGHEMAKLDILINQNHSLNPRGVKSSYTRIINLMRRSKTWNLFKESLPININAMTNQICEQMEEHGKKMFETIHRINK